MKKTIEFLRSDEAYKQYFAGNPKLEKAVKELIDEYKRLKATSIPKSLIKEKIEEYKKLLMSCNRFSDVDRIKAINERILAYEELLNPLKNV